MSTLFRKSETPRISILGYALPARFAFWFVRLWVAVVIVVSLLPGPYKERLGAAPADRTRIASVAGFKHRLIHVLAFGSSCFLVSLLALNRREQFQAACEVLLIGCFIEVAQDILFAHGKTLEWWDLRDDAIGIALAALALDFTRRKRG